MSNRLGVAVETILVVEDDPAISLGLQKNLRYEGYEVITATRGNHGRSAGNP